MTVEPPEPSFDDLTHAVESLETELREASERLAVALDERRSIQSHQHELQAERAQLDGRLSASRTRLQHTVDEAERAADQAPTHDLVLNARAEAREARAQLAEIEASTTEEHADLGSRLAHLEGQERAISHEIQRLEGEVGRLREMRTRLESDRQATRARDLEAELTRLAPLVEAQREAVSVTGIADLSMEYAGRAAHHSTQWKAWGKALAATAIFSAVAGFLLLTINHPPETASTAEAISRTATNLFVLGLLVFAVRFVAVQFRVHRHLETIASNKAAALATFNRIVAVASEPEVRTALATVLAQNVFASSDTGYSDGASDQVTMLERLAAPLTNRTSGS